MKKASLKILSLTLLLGCIVGCGGETSSPSTSSNQPVSTSSSNAQAKNKYEHDTTDYSSLEMAPTTKVRFHYHRADQDENYTVYNEWSLWVWGTGDGARYQFTHYDDFGVFGDVELSKVGTDVTQIGHLVSTSDWAKKDYESDRFLDIKAESPGGIQNVYLMSGQAEVFDNPEDASKPALKSAVLSSNDKISFSFVNLPSSFTFDEKKLTIMNGENKFNAYTASFNSYSKMVTLTLTEQLDITQAMNVIYKIDDDTEIKTKIVITTYFDSDEFKNAYTYTGDDLGVTFDNEEMVTKTNFKVWAPTSQKLVLKVYESGTPLENETVYKEVEMVKGEKGTWATTINEDLHGKYYTYVVTNASGTNEVVDPYAKSTGLNGLRGMVVNFTKLNKTITGWSSDTRANLLNNSNNLTDASIYELHVRDMTISETSGIQKSLRGKFLGLASEGTTYTSDGVTVSTGLDHIAELGVTHVQIQPVYDFNSVDESKSTTDVVGRNSGQYNWGYDPLNYNALEGSYSTNPSDGFNRIVEFKQMIMALHNKGININMDVVYNHTASLDNTNFELLVPYYYHRSSSDGKFSNGSGCGNEMASDRSMVNKFIVDSTAFYMKEYHLSGFRFDLMGLIDNQTMIDVYSSCKKIDPNAMIYGEPWTGGTTTLRNSRSSSNLSKQQTLQTSLAQEYFEGAGIYVGAFNDKIRNGIRGDNNPSKGFVTGGAASGVLDGLKGIFDGTTESNISPQQVINYVSCHDNYTLYDQLAQTIGSRDLMKTYKQADMMVFTSQGIPFIQEGEEFARSKAYLDDEGKTQYEGNSYNVGDEINKMDYSLKIKNKELNDFFKDLIKVRKDHEEFRYVTRSEIRNNFVKNDSASSSYMYTLNNNIVVIHTSADASFTLDGTYDTLLSNFDSLTTYSSSISLKANESIILKKK